mgnify:CR=1 FL=1
MAVTISVVFDDDQLEDLRTLAEADDRPLSSLLRRIVTEYLTTHPVSKRK